MTRWAQWPWRLAIAISLIAVLVYFRVRRDDYPHQRSKRAEAAKRMAVAPPSDPDPIEIAVVWPREGSPSSFLRGVHLAEQQINRDGGVRQTDSNGRQFVRRLRMRYFDEPSPTTNDRLTGEGSTIAREIARQTSILAVVGHNTDSIMPASVVYHDSGVLLVAPTNMDRRVTLHRFENVFRTAPRYRQVAKAMVDAVDQIINRKQVRLAVLYPSAVEMSADEVEHQLTRRANVMIESYGEKVDFSVALARQYDRTVTDHRHLIDPLLQGESLYDMILILDVLPHARNLRQQLEEGFSYSTEDPNFEKTTVDLSQLDWTGDQELYGDFSDPAEIESVLDSAVALVLREASQKVVILASRDSYGKGLGAELRTVISDTQDDPINPLRLEMYRAYGSQSESHLPIVAEVLLTECEYLFVAGTDDAAVKLIDQLRKAGMNRPIICGPDLEYHLITDREMDVEIQRVRLLLDGWLREGNPTSVEELLVRLREQEQYQGTDSAVYGYLAEQQGRTFVASVFDSESLSSVTRQFIRDYKREYNVDKVDALAAQGYHAVHLLRDAFERGGNSDPNTSAAAMRLFVEDDGIFGKNRFSENGDLLGLEIVFKYQSGDRQVNLIRLNRADLPPRRL